MAFLALRQDQAGYLSDVVHMDEAPHMHLSFVPLTANGRLSAKVIVGNRNKPISRQNAFWKHVVKKSPELKAWGERQQDRPSPTFRPASSS